MLLRDRVLRVGDRSSRADRAGADPTEKSAPCETRRGFTLSVLVHVDLPAKPRRTHVRRGAYGAPPSELQKQTENGERGGGVQLSGRCGIAGFAARGSDPAAQLAV